MPNEIHKISSISINGNEPSIVLRILVVIMLLIGIGSAAIAAKLSIYFVILASIGLIAGSICSYLSLNNNKKLLKIFISLGMLSLLFFCSCCTVKPPSLQNIKPFVLPLIIFLQILHSFNCPKRENLKLAAYTAMVLVGLSVNVALGTYWGVFLALFMAVAVLVFFYEDLLSRGYTLSNFKGLFKDFDYLQFVKLFISIFILSLLIFTIIPRIQLIPDKGFKVSANIEYPGNFSTSIEKGPGSGLGGSGGGQSGGSGDGGQGGLGGLLGQLKSWLSGQNNSGSNSGNKGGQSNNGGGGGGNSDPEIDLKNKNNKSTENILLFKYKCSEPQYLRALSYDYYTGDGWKLSQPEEVEYIESNTGNEILLPRSKEPLVTDYKTIRQYFFIEQMRTNLIVSSYKAVKLYFPVDLVMIDPNEALRSPVTTEKGFEYTSIVETPVIYEKEILQQEPEEEKALKADYPERFPQYLQLPDTVTERTAKLAKDITKNAKNDYEKANTIREYLNEKYIASSDKQDTIPKASDAVDYFLFKTKTGSYTDFASALTVMLRSQNIPARLVFGYYPGVLNPFTDFYEVESKDGRAWVEAYIPNYGWIPLYQELYEYDPSVLNALLRYLQSLIMKLPFMLELMSLLKMLIAVLLRYYPVIICVILELIIFALIVFVALKLLKVFDKGQEDEVVLLYLSLCKKLKRYGFDKCQDETAVEFLNRIKTIKQHKLPNNKLRKISDNLDNIENATKIYLEIRFGKADDKTPELRTIVKEILKEV